MINEKKNRMELASARKNVSDKISVSTTDWHALEVCSLRAVMLPIGLK